ncbi:hypothetical protein FHS18_004421 [Paenibacillus phyllosphaerae]|uniref:Rv2525c-like glycoside hydrolase-like domain-containing protein n=1 Tax=Paenibacillus phyllosphaerae TaxID=274593 RepID=A0A7W5B0R0_9BACL|nr:glycoside hydrolase domain-containing protein [Paenibacillus phyllosphaerae]MBB3112335.1 hypothetical protein [Paenibacillus phyllosphaerae]
MANPVWGVDSAAPANLQLLNCVKNAYGNPKVWGRYIKTVPGAADGLTAQEVTFLRNNGIKILPIYSDFREAVGYQNGQTVARNAIFHAGRLGIPRNVAVFANVERFFRVDAAWIRGWVNTFYNSDFKPGIYNDPTEGGFSSAYCAAAAEDEKVSAHTILWSAEPEPGVSKEREAPAYNPIKPPCEAHVWGWQYGRDAEDCSIDTNLFSPLLLPHLWG